MTLRKFYYHDYVCYQLLHQHAKREERFGKGKMKVNLITPIAQYFVLDQIIILINPKWWISHIKEYLSKSSWCTETKFVVKLGT